jgi:predicted DNA-binding transcriptional regulator AlpA
MEVVDELLASTAPVTKPELRGRKLQTRHLCARYGVSDRTIDRWAKDARLRFPQPIRVNGRRYWDESDIAAFDAKQKGAAK